MSKTTYEVQRTSGERIGYYVVGTSEDGKFIASPVYRRRKDAQAHCDRAAVIQLPPHTVAV